MIFLQIVANKILTIAFGKGRIYFIEFHFHMYGYSYEIL